MLTSSIQSANTKIKSIYKLVEFSLFEGAIELEITKKHFFLRLVVAEVYISAEEFQVYWVK